MPPQTMHLVGELRSDLGRRSLRGAKQQAVADLRQLAALWGLLVEKDIYTRYNRLILTKKMTHRRRGT